MTHKIFCKLSTVSASAGIALLVMTMLLVPVEQGDAQCDFRPPCPNRTCTFSNALCRDVDCVGSDNCACNGGDRDTCACH